MANFAHLPTPSSVISPRMRWRHETRLNSPRAIPVGCDAICRYREPANVIGAHRSGETTIARGTSGGAREERSTTVPNPRATGLGAGREICTVLLPGDLIVTAPREGHWHGVAPASFMCHLAVMIERATRSRQIGGSPSATKSISRGASEMLVRSEVVATTQSLAT